MHAGLKSDYPIITGTVLETYDAFLLGIPTRFGSFPGQWKAFWDTTGKQWSTGGFWGKYAGLFIGTATQGGEQQSTAISAMSTLAHHGMIMSPSDTRRPSLSNPTSPKSEAALLEVLEPTLSVPTSYIFFWPLLMCF